MSTLSRREKEASERASHRRICIDSFDLCSLGALFSAVFFSCSLSHSEYILNIYSKFIPLHRSKNFTQYAWYPAKDSGCEKQISFGPLSRTYLFTRSILCLGIHRNVHNGLIRSGLIRLVAEILPLYLKNSAFHTLNDR